MLNLFLKLLKFSQNVAIICSTISNHLLRIFPRVTENVSKIFKISWICIFCKFFYVFEAIHNAVSKFLWYISTISPNLLSFPQSCLSYILFVVSQNLSHFFKLFPKLFKKEFLPHISKIVSKFSYYLHKYSPSLAKDSSNTNKFYKISLISIFYIVVVTKKPPMCRILRYHFIAWMGR